MRAQPGDTMLLHAGLVLPPINDNFTSSAPHLDASELNQPEPHYGPRWISWKSF
jgi:hypothetical protein